MEHEAHIRDDSQDIGLVLVVKGNGIVIAACHQDFRSGPLSEHLLLLVQGVAKGVHVLLEHQLVEQRQISRIVADGILYQKNGTHSLFEAVVLRIHLVLDELDDGQDQVGAVVPAEGVIDTRTILFEQLLVDFLGKGGQDHHRCIRTLFLYDVGKVKNLVTTVVHQDEEIVIFLLNHLHRLGNGLGTVERRRIGKAQFRIFAIHLLLNVTVLFENETVVIVTNQENPADSPGHKGIVLICFHQKELYESLLNHRVGNFDEAGDVCALDVVDITVLLGTVLQTGSVDVGHNAVESLVNLLCSPLDTHRVL